MNTLCWRGVCATSVTGFQSICPGNYLRLGRVSLAHRPFIHFLQTYFRYQYSGIISIHPSLGLFISVPSCCADVYMYATPIADLSTALFLVLFHSSPLFFLSSFSFDLLPGSSRVTEKQQYPVATLNISSWYSFVVFTNFH